MRTLHHNYVETFISPGVDSWYGESWALKGILLDVGVRGGHSGYYELGFKLRINLKV